jgi:Ca-activated chloride channel family protein
MRLPGFTSPWWFLLLVLIAGLVAGYVLMQRRRQQYVLRFANLAMLERVAPSRPPWWQRHLPVALLLTALVVLTVALAGPTAEQRVPRNRATVMLVIDVSLSMQATDVSPSRLAAAQRSATAFADSLTPGINLGLVSFAGSPTVLVSPTTDRNSVKEGIRNLKLAEATGTGEAIYAALASIEAFGSEIGGGTGPPPARIVLLSDGKQTVPTSFPDKPRGAFPAAQAAAQANIPISAISFGTQYGRVEINGTSQLVPTDDATLHKIADLSHGQFFNAETAGDLEQVYSTLAEQIGYETKRADASKPWVVAATVLMIMAAGAAIIFWRRGVP